MVRADSLRCSIHSAPAKRKEKKRKLNLKNDNNKEDPQKQKYPFLQRDGLILVPTRQWTFLKTLLFEEKNHGIVGKLHVLWWNNFENKVGQLHDLYPNRDLFTLCLIHGAWCSPNLGPSVSRTVFVLVLSLKFHLLQKLGLCLISITLYSSVRVFSPYKEILHVF